MYAGQADHREITAGLVKLGNSNNAEHARRYFKTGPGEYGEGDRFLGIRMPVIRQQAKLFKDLSLDQTEKLLHSEYHEVRMMALIIWTMQFGKQDTQGRQNIARKYLSNTRYINNWDLVDCSAHLIIGPWAQQTSVNLLKNLARSSCLWERRIAMMSTLHFIRNREFSPALEIAVLLLNDREDLIHKCVGWMLREVGNRDRKAEENFLFLHYKTMPRTMLRYAIEKFPEARRKDYLNSLI